MIADATHVAINLDDPAVHRHRCTAFAGLERLFADANVPGGVAQAKALSEQYCSD